MKNEWEEIRIESVWGRNQQPHTSISQGAFYLLISWKLNGNMTNTSQSWHKTAANQKNTRDKIEVNLQKKITTQIKL